MAYKKMASMSITANQDIVIYTVPTLRIAISTLNICNTSDTSCFVNVSIGGIFIEKNTPLPSGGVLERTSLILEASEAVTVRTTNSCDVRLYGMEE